MNTLSFRKKAFFLIGFLSLLFSLSASPLLAQSGGSGSCEAVQEGFGPFTFKGSLVPCGRSCDVSGTPVNESEECTLCHLLIMLQNIFKFMLALLFIVAILFLTIGGVVYIVSAGNPGVKSTAKGIITGTLKGFGLFLLSWLIIVTIMKIIDANSTTLNSSSIFTFTCDTTSAYNSEQGGTPGGPQPPADKKCCILSTNTSDPNYGKSANCPAADGTSKTECEQWCQNGGGDSGYIASCKAGCTDTQSCTSKGGTLTENCSSQQACIANNTSNNPSGQCNPTNNGCGGLSTAGAVGDGCNYTSSNLAAKLACLKGKVPSAQVTSVTKNQTADWCANCAWSYAGRGKCAHSENSCHFGGTKCKGTSSAVDLTPSNAVAQAALQCGFDTVIWNGRELRTGKSASDHTDHVHASVDNKACGCDYQK